MNLEFDADLTIPAEHGEAVTDSDDTTDTVGNLYESIETLMWLAEAYLAQGNRALGVECLRSAWLEYTRFQDVLDVYVGHVLGRRLVEAMAHAAVDEPPAIAASHRPAGKLTA